MNDTKLSLFGFMRFVYFSGVRKRFAGIFLFLTSMAVQAQLDTISLLHYNILRFPEGNANKAPLFRPILNYLQPDVVTLNEITAIQALDSLDKYAFDTSRFVHAPWITDGELVSVMYYRKDRLVLHSQGFLNTDPRRTNYYKLYSRFQDFSAFPDTLFFTVFVAHFKSSQGSDNEAIRAQQASTVRTFMDGLSPGANVLFAGDFNVYRSTEPAWINLKAEGRHALNDPINREGSWSNNSSFADVHTQSPRTASFDLGVTGGLDDRFDFILASDAVMDGRFGAQILPETYTAIGNDGEHFNRAIIASPTNTSVPDSVLQALHDFSDHLPVFCKMTLNPQLAYNSTMSSNYWGINCDFNFDQLQEGKLLDYTGRIIAINPNKEVWSSLKSGMYIFEGNLKNGENCTQKVFKME
jgi:hypothetical protein